MARSRNIKPGFFTNDVLGELPPLARLLFAGLWTICDRSGRCEDRPKKIKAEVLPYDNCDADALLSALANAGFIDRYSVGGVRVIQVLAWDKHQNPHIKEAASTLPVRCEHGAGTVPEPCAAQPEPERAGLIPSLLIPDSLSLDSLSSRAAVAAKADDLFARFWEVYPCKKAKKDARKAFDKLGVDELLLATMLAALATQRLSPAWTKNGGEFIPHPATWLNGRRWEDATVGVPYARVSVHAGFETKNYREGVDADGSFA